MKLLRKVKAACFLSSIFVSGAVLAANTEIKIGFAAPLTGEHVKEGSFQVNAAKLAAKQVNSQGGIGGKKINLVIEDNQSTNPGAVAAFDRLANQHKSLVIVGPVKTPQVQALLPAVQKSQIPTITGATTPKLTEGDNKWLFRVRPHAGIVAWGMAKYIKEDLKVARIGILHDSDSFGSGGANFVEKNAKEFGLTVVKREKYDSGATDFKPQFEALHKAGAEIMIVYSNDWKDLAEIQRQHKAAGAKPPYFGSQTSQQKATIEAAKGASDGILAVADVVPGAAPQNRQFIAAYKAEYGEEPDMSQCWTFDAIHLFANAIKKAGEDRPKIREALLSVKNYEGMLGTFTFLSNGDGLHEASIVKVEKGTPKLLRLVRMQ